MKKLYIICAIITLIITIGYLIMNDIDNACLSGLTTLVILNTYAIGKLKDDINR